MTWVYDPTADEYSVEIVSKIIDVKANLQTPELYKYYPRTIKLQIFPEPYRTVQDGYRGVPDMITEAGLASGKCQKRNVTSTTDKMYRPERLISTDAMHRVIKWA